MRRAHLIMKPVPVPGVDGDPVTYIVRRLRQAGIECAVTLTRADRPVAEDVRAALATSPPPDLLIAGGGDGTHSPVARALVGTRVPLALIALGTFNNIARSIGVPRDLEAALHLIATGTPRPIDAGRVNDTVFFEVAGAGWDAALFPIGEQLKQGKFVGALSAARGLWRYRAEAITLRLDGVREVLTHTPTVIVANGPYYGSSLAVAPMSRLDDGLLTVTLFEGFGKAELLAHFAAVAEGRPRTDPRIVSHRAARVEIVSPPGLPAHADGEPVGALRTPFEVIPQAVQVIAPAADQSQATRRTAKWVRPKPDDLAAIAARRTSGTDAGRTAAWRPSDVWPAKDR